MQWTQSGEEDLCGQVVSAQMVVAELTAIIGIVPDEQERDAACTGNGHGRASALVSRPGDGQ